MWEVKSEDGMWFLHYDGKKMMKSVKLCRVMREFKKVKSDEKIKKR